MSCWIHDGHVPTPIVTLLGCSAIALLIHAAPARSQGFGSPTTLGEYVYAVPPGWNAAKYPDGVVLRSAVSQTGEQCLISLWPLRAAAPTLERDAALSFTTIFRTYEPRTETSAGGPITPTVVRGTSGQGWDYLIFKRGIGKPPNAAGRYETLLGFVFVARVGDQVATISGLSKDPLVSSCLGELIADAWPQFFYSLRFRSYAPPIAAPAIPPKLIGTWTSASATAADQFTFTQSGRYGGASAVQHYDRVSGGEVLATTQALFGDGTFTVREDTLTLTPDDHARPQQNAHFRIEEESTDGGHTWKNILYVLRTSAVDGKDYEVRYRKQ